MRVSDHYGIGKTQPTLEFVDVDIKRDTKVYLDPHALRHHPSPWASEWANILTAYFQKVVDAIRSGKGAEAKRLLKHLNEPNETRFGLSADRADGNAIGPVIGSKIYESLARSDAVKSGLLRDLEETALMIEGVRYDRISDIATNILRAKLLEYTQEMASKYSLPLVQDVYVGPVFDHKQGKWKTEYSSCLMADNRPLVLVPKSIVRRNLFFDPGEYYTHFILEELKDQETRSVNSSLVHMLKNGKRIVYKKDLRARNPDIKATNEQVTVSTPAVLDRYRSAKSAEADPPLSHEQISAISGSPPPDWDRLLADVTSIRPGKASATLYEKAIEPLLNALFYPELVDSKSQANIHEGRKRIDITFNNVASDRRGLFYWISKHYPSAKIMVECKNYKEDPENPELDQLSGRFGKHRGNFGLLVCRKIADKPLIANRCRDTALDHRGFICAIDDDDLRTLVADRRNGSVEFPLLKRMFDALI